MFGEDFKPRYGAEPVYVEHLRSNIDIGAFVLVEDVEDDEGGGPPVVARILDQSRGPCRVKLQVFQKLGSIEGIAVQAIEDGPAGKVPEVVQMEKIWSRPAKAIVDVAFVFPLSTIVDGFAVCQGISNAFLCRFEYNEDTTELEEIDILSFPSKYEFERPPVEHSRYDDCLPWRLWCSVSILQDTIMKALNRVSSCQGIFSKAREKISLFPRESWAYICRRVSLEPIKRSGRRVRQRLLYGLKGQSKRVDTEVEILRFETTNQLNLLRCLLGISGVTAGVRRPKPRLGETKYLKPNDIVNVIVGQETVEEPFVLRTNKEGIDLTYNQHELVIALCYSKYVYAADTDGAPVGCPCPHVEKLLSSLPPVEDNDDMAPPQPVVLVKDAMFEFNGMVLKVFSVARDVITAKVVAPQGRRNEMITFSGQNHEDIADRILAYNNA